MISSIVLKKETISIDFIKIEIDILTGKMITHIANIHLFDEGVKEHVLHKHRVYLPCNIDGYRAIIFVPDFWDVEAIGNYTQALMDELYMNKNNIPGCKTLEQIKDSFMLEMIVL